MVRGELEDRRPGRVLAQSAHLIARKTVERAGETGEEGIARSNADLKHILTAAVGGGLFIALTALVKYVEPKGLPPFFEALYGALNYGGSFTVMHFLHLKLATKLPAMTASALSTRLSDRPSPESDAEFVSTAAAILRTQLAAVVGNLVGVIPAAVLVDSAIRLAGRGHLLTADKAAQVIESVSPWASLTIPFAMFTGVILWVGGWVASWIDNAFVFYNVRGALASHGGLRVRFGEKRVEAFAAFLAKHVGGVATALVLGVGLAFAPEVGRFFGLPLEVRHVTLVTGSLSLAA
jgi:site-specific recombinase